LLQFTRRLLRFRHRHPVFCRRRWFQGRPIHGSEVSDVGWFTPRGSEMSEEDWRAGFAKSLGVFLNGGAIPTPNERGEQIVDDSFYIMFNAHHEPLDFTLPESKWGSCWSDVLDTSAERDLLDEETAGSKHAAASTLNVQAWSLRVLRKTA
jgi:glycogen operon protein